MELYLKKGHFLGGVGYYYRRKEKVRTKEFDCFNVHFIKDNYSFCHIEIEDNPTFYENLFEYFFGGQVT